MTDDDSTTPFVAQRVNSAPFRANASLKTRSFDGNPDRIDLGMADRNQQPTVWDAVGYPSEDEFTFDTFWLRYQRQGEATAIIDKPVEDTWQDEPDIVDEGNEDGESQTGFEESVEELLSGDHTRRRPIHRLKVADRLARIGEYAFIVFGFADGADMEQPVAGPGGEDEEPALDGPDDLHYIATYAQDRVVDVEFDTDPSSPRFMLPEYVELQTTDPHAEDLEGVGVAETDDDREETQKFHWTRFLHVPEGEMESDFRGTPALKPVFHELLMLDKIKGAAGEGYWRGGYQGLVVRPPEIDAAGTGKQMGRFEDGGDAVAKQIDQFLNNWQRTITTTGTVESIDTDVSDPLPFMESCYRTIEVALDIPRSQFAGSDRADTADDQNATDWDTTVARRRNGHAQANLLEPFVQRLIDVGVLPEPTGDTFDVEWPPRAELDEKEEAEVQNTMAQAMNRVSPDGDPTHHWTTEEIRDKFGDHPERGMEVDEEFQPDEDEMEDDAVVDEQALREFQEQAEAPAPAELQGQQPPGQQPPAQPDGGEEQQ